MIPSTIKTDRLLLRKLTLSDAKDVFEWVGDERVSKYMIYTTYKEIKEVEKWISSLQNNVMNFEFGFERLSDGKLIGSGSVRYESEKDRWIFGYNLRYDCWGNGYATEAAKAMINFAQTNFNARKFASCHCEPNIASGKVMKKCGLHFVGYGKFEKLDGSCPQRTMEYEGVLDAPVK